MKTKSTLILGVAVLGLAAVASNAKADGFSFGITIGHVYAPPVYVAPPVVYAPPVYAYPAPAPCPPVRWVRPIVAPRAAVCPPRYVVCDAPRPWPRPYPGHGYEGGRGHGHRHGRGHGH